MKNKKDILIELLEDTKEEIVDFIGKNELIEYYEQYLLIIALQKYIERYY